MIYYLHEGRKNSNEAILKQEYLINGSNMFSKMYLRQLFLDNHLSSLENVLLWEFKRKQCLHFKQKRIDTNIFLNPQQ